MGWEAGEEGRIPQRGIECRWYAGGDNELGRIPEVGVRAQSREGNPGGVANIKGL